jgi:hypothetical protein
MLKLVYDHHITAPVNVVWEVITGFGDYGEWNSFTPACDAQLQPGAPITMTVKLGRRVIRQTESVSEVVPQSLFEYRMKPLGPFLRSYRQHRITAAGPNDTQYQSVFVLYGWLSPIVGWLMAKDLAAGFERMSGELKKRAESVAAKRAQSD